MGELGQASKDVESRIIEAVRTAGLEKRFKNIADVMAVTMSAMMSASVHMAAATGLNIEQIREAFDASLKHLKPDIDKIYKDFAKQYIADHRELYSLTGITVVVSNEGGKYAIKL